MLVIYTFEGLLDGHTDHELDEVGFTGFEELVVDQVAHFCWPEDVYV